MNPPIPIIYIHHERALGGAPLSLLYLIRQLDQKIYIPHVLCLQEGAAADLFRKEKLPVQILHGPDLSHTELVWFRWWQFPKLLLKLFQSIFLFFRLRKAFLSIIQSSICPESGIIVHLNSSTLVIAALAAQSLSLPLVWHIREPLAHGYLGFRRSILRMAIRNLANHIIAISHHDAAQLGVVASQQITVIHNFVNFLEFDSKLPGGSLRKELKTDQYAPIILFLGGSAQVKGADVLLQSAPKILESVQNSHLVIAGETSALFHEKTTISLSSYSNRIHLLGPRRDIPSLLADTTLLVFPATVPHFARPIIEAAAMAKPVVASDLDGIRELVVRNETAVLVPANDSSLLAKAIIDLIEDPARAYRLGQQGHAIAREKFDAQRNAAATFAIYQNLIKSRSRQDHAEIFSAPP